MAGGRKRRIGEIKPPARRGSSSRGPRSIGRVKERPGAFVGLKRTWGRTCCPGVEVGGHWYHRPRCSWASVGWAWAGWTEEDWNCPWKCKPSKFASSWSHAWNCPHWDMTDATPFDSPEWEPREEQEGIPF